MYRSTRQFALEFLFYAPEPVTLFFPHDDEEEDYSEQINKNEDNNSDNFQPGALVLSTNAPAD